MPKAIEYNIHIYNMLSIILKPLVTLLIYQHPKVNNSTKTITERVV